MPTPRDPEKQAAQAAIKEERARDRVIAMQEYEAGRIAMKENMARLRVLRLAKEASEAPAAKPKARSRKTASFAK